MSNSAPSRAIAAVQNAAIVGVLGLAGYGTWYVYKVTDGKFDLPDMLGIVGDKVAGSAWCQLSGVFYTTQACAERQSGALDPDPNNIGYWTVLGASLATAVVTYKN